MTSILSLLLVLFVYAAQQPSLQETVDWLQSKAHLITYVDASSTKQDVMAKYRSQWSISLKEPCLLQMQSSGGPAANKKPKEQNTESPKILLKPESQSPSDPSTILIPLAKLNPQKLGKTTIEGIIAGGSVNLSTTDQAESIVWSNSDTVFNLSNVGIGFSDKQIVDRVLKAFQHAVTLCGGKPDKKEPF